MSRTYILGLGSRELAGGAAGVLQLEHQVELPKATRIIVLFPHPFLLLVLSFLDVQPPPPISCFAREAASNNMGNANTSGRFPAITCKSPVKWPRRVTATTLEPPECVCGGHATFARSFGTRL